MEKKRMSGTTGFTLVEILIVLGIIVVLAAIIYPVFAYAREKGRSATCQSNLKQIALMIQQYTEDSSGYYPFSDRGVSMLSYLPLAAQPLLFDCPSDPRFYGMTGSGYKYNLKLLKAENPMIGLHKSRFPDPASIWLHADWPLDMEQGSPESKYRDYVRFVSPKPGTPCAFVTWHSGGSNLSFLDGHVKWLTPEAACAMDNAS